MAVFAHILTSLMTFNGRRWARVLREEPAMDVLGSWRASKPERRMKVTAATFIQYPGAIATFTSRRVLPVSYRLSRSLQAGTVDGAIIALDMGAKVMLMRGVAAIMTSCE